MDEARVRGLIVEAFRTLSKTASDREAAYAYESGYDIARKSLAELVDTVNETVRALESTETMSEYLRGDEAAYSVSMTHREYRVVLAALEAVRDDGGAAYPPHRRRQGGYRCVRRSRRIVDGS